jgi:SAM-dependent methyltransferase
MHNSSFEKMKLFAEVYLDEYKDRALHILDFGSQSVDGAPLVLRNIFSTSNWTYTGVDIVSGHNVDVVLANPYSWDEIASDSLDVVVSGQTFEHVEYFWITMFEIGRVLKPGGIAVLIAPSNGFEHRYPVDCWRFYRDGFAALSKMIDFKFMEGFTDWGRTGDAIWCDTIGIFQKPLWDLSSKKLFAEKCEASYRTLPNDLHLPRLPRPSQAVVNSPLESLKDVQITSLLEKIRVGDLDVEPGFKSRLRQSFKILLGKNTVGYLRKFSNTPIPEKTNSWGTNSEVLRDGH